MKQFEIITHSSYETKKLGFKMGKTIEKGFVITLNGELGSGKTVYVQGLAAGLEVPQNYKITSPTFTLINEYTGRLKLFHVDLYRINNIEDLDDIGFHDIFYQKGLVAIEWSDKLPKKYFNDFLTIDINIEIIDDLARRFKIRKEQEK